MNHSETKKLVVTTGVPSTNVFAERVSLVNEAGQQVSTKTDAELNSRLLPAAEGAVGQVPIITDDSPYTIGWGDGGGGGGALSDLSDVNASTPTLGEVLTWDGTDWVADPITIDLASAPTTTPSVADFLTGTDTSAGDANVKFLVSDVAALAAGAPSTGHLRPILTNTMYGIPSRLGVVSAFNTQRNQTHVADVAYVFPFSLGAPITISAACIDVQTATVSGNARAAIYNAEVNVATGLIEPTTPVVDMGSVVTTSTGLKSFTVNQSLGIGLYALVYVVDVNTILKVIQFIPYDFNGVSVSGGNWLVRNSAGWTIPRPYASGVFSEDLTAGVITQNGDTNGVGMMTAVVVRW